MTEHHAPDDERRDLSRRPSTPREVMTSLIEAYAASSPRQDPDPMTSPSTTAPALVPNTMTIVELDRTTVTELTAALGDVRGAAVRFAIEIGPGAVPGPDGRTPCDVKVSVNQEAWSIGRPSSVRVTRLYDEE